MSWRWLNGHGWIRLLGVGFRLRDLTRHPPMFSERFAGAWFVDVGTWRLSGLGAASVVTWLPRRGGTK